MMWDAKEKKYDDGEYRYIKRIAIFPIKAGDKWKWLEVCYIRQRCVLHCDEEFWINDKFVDKSLYKGYRHSNKLDGVEV